MRVKIPYIPTKILNNQLIIKIKKEEAKRTKASAKTIQYFSMDWRDVLIRSEKKAEKILNPSKPGTGIRLKTASEIFIKTA